MAQSVTTITNAQSLTNRNGTVYGITNVWHADQTKPVSDNSTDKHPKQNEQDGVCNFWHDVAFFLTGVLCGVFCFEMGWRAHRRSV